MKQIRLAFSMAVVAGMMVVGSMFLSLKDEREGHLGAPPGPKEAAYKVIYLRTCDGVESTITQQEYEAKTWPNGCTKGYAGPDTVSLKDNEYYQEVGQKVYKKTNKIYVIPDTTTISAYMDALSATQIATVTSTTP